MEKQRLYNEEGRLTPIGKKISYEFSAVVEKFLNEKYKIYDIRDLENMMHWDINDEVLNKILGL